MTKGWPEDRATLFEAVRRAQTEAVASAAGVTLTTRRPRLVPNCTAPASRANSVSSPPRPTPSPGWKWVPRWRTRISPALTTWPPKRFTPRNWALESRPLREELAPFLWAMCLLLPGVDGRDADPRQPLAVTEATLVAGLVLVLQDVDLRALGVGHDLAADGDAGEGSSVGRDVGAVDDEQRRQRHGVAGAAGDLLDLDDVTHGDLVLLAAGLDDGVHEELLPGRDQRCRARGAAEGRVGDATPQDY